MKGSYSMQILSEIVTDNGAISSARVINLGGFIIGSTLLMYHGLWLDKLDAEVYGLYLGYCAGVYGTGKWIERKYKDDRYTDESSDRHKAGYNNNDEYNVTGSRDR